eukprot:759278-Hanusia_phi.AAC.4
MDTLNFLQGSHILVKKSPHVDLNNATIRSFSSPTHFLFLQGECVRGSSWDVKLGIDLSHHCRGVPCRKILSGLSPLSRCMLDKSSRGSLAWMRQVRPSTVQPRVHIVNLEDITSNPKRQTLCRTSSMSNRLPVTRWLQGV